MFMKMLFIALVPFGLLFFEITGQCFADIPAQLQQAEAYMKDVNYKQAEAIYMQIVTDYAFQAQKNLIVLYVATNNQTQANATLGQLLANFAEHERLPHTIHEITEKCHESGKANRVRELYQHLLDNQPNSAQAIWMQMGLAISNILLENDTGAWAETGKLLVNFSADERCAEAVGQVAWSYRKLKQYENAHTLYQHVVNNWPDRPRAIFSQRGIVLTSIALGDDTTAEAATQKLLRQFSQDEHMPEVVSKIGDTYLGLEKYEKARELHQYILDNHPDSEEAIWSQRGVILSSISLGDDANTEAGIEKLLAQFSSNKNIAKAAYQVARKLNNKAEAYRDQGKYEKARELHQYILDNHPDSEEAILSQRGVILSSIGLGDDRGTEAGIEKLLAQFSSNKLIAEMVYQVARKLNKKAETYRDLGKYEKARELHQYILDNHPDFEDAIWSQRGVILSSIRLGDDVNTEAGIEKLLAQFSSNKNIAKAAYQVARKLNNKAETYRDLGKYEKARELHQYILDNHPDFEDAIWSQRGVILSSIGLGDDANTEAGIEKLLMQFSSNKLIAKMVYQIARKLNNKAETYRDLGKYEKARELHQYILDNHPDSEEAILSQRGVILSSIGLGDDRGTEAGIEKLLTQFSSNKLIAEMVYQVARELNNKNDQKAQELCEYVIDKYSSSEFVPLARVNIGDIKLQLGDDKAARVIFDRVLSDFAGHPILPRAVDLMAYGYYRKALLKDKKGFDEQANWYYQKTITECERIITQLPETLYTTAEACYFSAVCYGRLGQHEKAIKYYQKVVDNWPEYKYAWLAQSKVAKTYKCLLRFGVMSEPEAEAAIKVTFEHLVKKFPDCPSAKAAHGWLSYYHKKSSEGGKE